MITGKRLVAVLILFWLGDNVHAQPLASPSKPARYPGIKMWFNHNLSQAVTNEQRLNLYRQTLAQGRHSGTPMLTRMFHNFSSESFKLLPTTPGLSDTVRLVASDNRNAVIGHARTLRYAMNLQEDGRFKVEALNQPRSNARGRTDADIAFRHLSTGSRGRIEVKYLSLASQRANLAGIKSQILKMAEDARVTGEVQVWANRRDVLPEVREFAQRHGINVIGRLRTGSTSVRPGDRSFREFADGLDRELRAQAKWTAMTGSVRLGMGAFLVYQSMQLLQDDRARYRGTNGDWLRIGEHGSTLLAGTGWSTAGVVQIARGIPSLANSARLISLTKWGGRLGIAGTILAEGFLVCQYGSGNLTERQFWHGQASLGGGLVGGSAGGFVGFKAGALAGGLIGSFFGPVGTVVGAGIGGTIGTLGGGFGGGYAGAYLAGRSVNSLYQLQDRQQ